MGHTLCSRLSYTAYTISYLCRWDDRISVLHHESFCDLSEIYEASSKPDSCALGLEVGYPLQNVLHKKYNLNTLTCDKWRKNNRPTTFGETEIACAKRNRIIMIQHNFQIWNIFQYKTSRL